MEKTSLVTLVHACHRHTRLLRHIFSFDYRKFHCTNLALNLCVRFIEELVLESAYDYDTNDNAFGKTARQQKLHHKSKHISKMPYQK